MRKKLKKLLALAICLVVATSFAANIPGLQNVIKVKADTVATETRKTTVDGIEWRFIGYANDSGVFNVKSIEATLKNKTLTDVVIPDAVIINDIEYKITSIPYQLFMDNTYVKTVILGNNIVHIQGAAFKNCSNLMSVRAKNKEQSISIWSGAFMNCENLNEVDMKIGDISQSAFDHCTSLKKINDFAGEKIDHYSFWYSGIEEINFSGSQEKLKIYGFAFCNSQLKNIKIPCPVTLQGGAFSKCSKLTTAEFEGIVTRETYLYHQKSDSIFQNSFSREYDDNGNLIQKKVIFHKEVCFEDFASESNDVGDFMNCTGLSEVVFEDCVTIPTGTFYNCSSLTDIVFLGDARLGDSALANMDKLKESITFYGSVISNGDPFNGSTIKNVIFNPSYDSDNLKKVCCSFNSTGVETIEYGKYVTNISGTINEDAKILTIIIQNPSVELDITDKETQFHDVYGYGCSIAKYSKIESWTRQNFYAKFCNLVQENSLQVIDKLKFYGQKNKNEIDFRNLTVKYLPTLCATTNKAVILCSDDDIDYNGYVVNTDFLPDVLTPGTYEYLVTYSGQKTNGTIVVEDIVPTKLEVDWDKDYIENLVAGQDLSIQDVVSGVAITYNNGAKKTFGKDQFGNISVSSGSSISLENEKTILGNNTFKVVYNETSEYGKKTVIDDSDDFTIRKNYITKISANVAEKERYVGDTVSIDDFEVLATYKYNEDPTVEHKLKPTSVENTVLTVSGSNIVKVNYNNFSENVTVSAIEVCPAKIVAAFDKNNAYIDGQTKYDLDAFNVAVTYNNGDSKDNYEQKNLSLTEDNCVVEELLRTSSEATVILKYTENGVTVESQEIVVPITEKKPTSLNVVSNIDSMVEGSEFDKSNITSIEITYNNGNTEVQDSTLIDYVNLSISQDPIVANQKNTITVTYLGIKTTIDVVGTAKTVNRIEAVYVGEPVIVGNYFDAADVEFTLFYNNGQSEVISSGFVIKDADKQVIKAGPNEVYVYYDAMYTTITVPGIASDIIPTNTLNPVPTSTSDSGISPTELPLANNEQTMAPAATTTAPTTTETTAPAATTTTAPTAATTTAPTATTNIATNNIPGALSTSFNIISNHKLIKLSGDLNSKVYTNKKIEITIDATNANNIQYQIITGKNALSENGWKNVSGSKITVNKSNKASVIYFRYKDATGNTVNTHTCYFTIDKQKAKINVKNGKTYKTGFKLKFSDASGIDYAKLDGKNTKNNTKITKKGLHKIIVLDKAGNKKIVKFKVK